jgi:hypothetical protein
VSAGIGCHQLSQLCGRSGSRSREEGQKLLDER